MVRTVKKRQTSSRNPPKPETTSHNGNGHTKNGIHRSSNGRIPYDAVNQWKQGDFSTLQQTLTVLYLSVRGLSGDHDVAEQAVQETMYGLFCKGKIDLYDEERDSDPWLLTLSMNKARDILRGRKRSRRTLSYNQLIDENENEDGDRFIEFFGDGSVMAPDEIMCANERREQADLIKKYILKRCEEGNNGFKSFYLTIVLGISYGETARDLKIPEGTVKSGIYGARKRLRREFQHLDGLIHV